MYEYCHFCQMNSAGEHNPSCPRYKMKAHSKSESRRVCKQTNCIMLEEAKKVIDELRIWKEGAINFYPDLEKMTTVKTILGEDNER